MSGDFSWWQYYMNPFAPSNVMDQNVKLLEDMVATLKTQVETLKSKMENIKICSCGGTCSCHHSKQP